MQKTHKATATKRIGLTAFCICKLWIWKNKLL